MPRKPVTAEVDYSKTLDEPGYVSADEERREEFVRNLLQTKGDPVVDRLSEAAIVEAETVADLAKDDRGWIGDGGGGTSLTMNATARQRTLKQAYHLYYRDPLARNIIRVLAHLTIGKGLRVKFAPEDEPGASERWAIIARNNRWERRYRNVIRLTYLLGEWFVVRRPLLGDKYWDKGLDRPDHEKIRAAVAALPPERIRLCGLSPLEVSGVKLSEMDREQARAYTVPESVAKAFSKAGEGFTGAFSASDVTHFRIDDLEIDERGHSILEPVLRQIAYYRAFQLDRLTMTAIRTRIPIVRKVPGLFKASAKTSMESQKMPRPGTIAIVDEKETWEYPGGPNDGTTALNEGRGLQLQIAAGVSLPEFIVTADSANGNFASTLVAASPITSMIADYRNIFLDGFCELITEIVGAEPTLEFPEIVTEDIEKLVRAMSLLFNDGAMSLDTYRARVGLDPETEAEKIDQERDEAMPRDLTEPAPGDEEPKEDESDDDEER
jgi:hypothetical protein